VVWGSGVSFVHSGARLISGKFRVDYAQPGLPINTYRWVEH